MKLNFQANFYTDGDFGFNEERIDFDTKSSMYKEADINYSYEEDDYHVRIYLTAEGNANACRYALRDLLEDLMCNIVIFKHWLVKDIYGLLEYFHQDLWGETNQRKSKMMYGNYDDTFVSLRMEE